MPSRLPVWLKYRCLSAARFFPLNRISRYFESEIRPRLGPEAHFLGPVGWTRKRRLVECGALSLWYPSLGPRQTSSLVAMEAIACGTPVVAFPAGALTRIVEPGVTGYLVGDAREMARAIHAIGSLDPGALPRGGAPSFFWLERMVRGYFALYHRLARNPTSESRDPQSPAVTD